MLLVDQLLLNIHFMYVLWLKCDDWYSEFVF